MSEKEKKLVENIAALPDTVKAEFLSQIQGAATAVKVLGAEQPPQEGGTEHEPGEGGLPRYDRGA